MNKKQSTRPVVRIDSPRTCSFLRWAGSKRKVLPQLAQYWRPDYKRYIEPFAGSASLFFQLGPSRAVLSDINGELIGAYEIVRDNPDAFHKALAAFPVGEDHYYRIRSQNPNRLSQFSRAVRFVYLNRHCFNGIYRTNRKGRFNVPFGGQRAGVIPSLETFRKCALLLQCATLRVVDFEKALRDTRKGDFVYLDPPYAVEKRRIFCEYGPKAFSTEDLTRLGLHLDRAHGRGVHFVVSYADCSQAREVFKPWKVKRIRVRRHIAGFASDRRSAYELIATNAT